MNIKLRTALVIALATVATPAIAGDSRSPDTEKPGIGQPGDVSPPVAQALVDDVNIGTAVGSNGHVPADAIDDFLPGEAIYLTMDVSDAAPGTEIRVVWIGPDDQRIAEQRQRVVQGARTLKFVKSDTRLWQPGDYRAEVWVGDEKVNDEVFDVVLARSARN
jgi:hypothetical protein